MRGDPTAPGQSGVHEMSQNPGMDAPYGQQPGYPAPGQPVVVAPSSRGGILGSAAVQVIGGVVALIGVFLSFQNVTVQGYNLSKNGLGSVSGAPAGAGLEQMTAVGHGVRLIVLAAIAIVGGIVVFVTKKAPTATVGLIGGAGLVVQGLIDYFDLKGQIDDAAGSVDASIGVGIWMVIAGGAVALIGAIFGLVAGRKRV